MSEKIMKNNNDYTLEILRSNRKTLSITVTPAASVLVRAPFYMPEAKIHSFLTEKAGWIQKQLDKARAALKEQESLSPISMDEIRHLAEQALQYIPPRVNYFARLAGIEYGRITIRNQTSRWGSCSARGNLNFNCLLMLAPPDVIDYVIVHELCHRIEMNHSPRFWQEVGKILPDYKTQQKWLNEHGRILIARMRAAFRQNEK